MKINIWLGLISILFMSAVQANSSKYLKCNSRITSVSNGTIEKESDILMPDTSLNISETILQKQNGVITKVVFASNESFILEVLNKGKKLSSSRVERKSEYGNLEASIDEKNGNFDVTIHCFTFRNSPKK